MFGRATAVACDRLPRILKMDLYHVSYDFVGQIPVKRYKFGHADLAIDVREAFFIIVETPKSVGPQFTVCFQKLDQFHIRVFHGYEDRNVNGAGSK